MSDIFKKGVEKDLSNLGVKNPEAVLNTDVLSKATESATSTTPTGPAKQPAATIPVKKISQAEINKGFSSQDAFEKAFSATPDKTLSQSAIQKAPSKTPKPVIVPEKEKQSSAAILKDVNEGFTKPKILPTAPIATTIGKDMKPGEMFYLDPNDEYVNRKIIGNSIEQGLKTGVNPLTKQKLSEKQRKTLTDINTSFERQTLLENIEQGNIGTDDINTWKRTNLNSPFQQVLPPTEIIKTTKQPIVQIKYTEPLVFTKEKKVQDIKKSSLVLEKLNDEYSFQKSVFGEEYAKQQRAEKLKTPVFGKAGTTTGEEIIAEAKSNITDLQKQLNEVNTNYNQNKNRIFEEQAVLNKTAKTFNKPAAGSGYYAVDQDLIKYGVESKRLSAQIQRNKDIIENPYGKSNAEIGAAKELESYLITQVDLLKTPKERMQDQMDKITLANQQKLPVFNTIPGSSRLSFYDPSTKKTSIIPANNVKDVFKFMYNKSYNEITTTTDPKNLKTYAEIAAYVEKFPNTKFAKNVLRLGEETGKTLGFQGDWLPDLIKKNKAYDNEGNLNSRIGFSDDPIAVYAASLNSQDKSNPLLEGRVTQSFISNWAKDFFVNSSLNSDKQFILADRMDRQDMLDRYTNIEKPILLDRLKNAKNSGDQEEVKNIEHLIQLKEDSYNQRLQGFQKDDERYSVLLKSADARMSTKGQLSDEFENLKRNGNLLASSADGTRQFLEFMAPTMIMELATAGLATPEMIAASSAGAFAKTAGTMAYRAIKVAAPLYSRLNESMMEVSGARTDFYDKKLNTLLEKNKIQLPLTATVTDKEKALLGKGVSNVQLADLRLQSKVGTNALFWKNMALVIPDLVELDFLSSTLLGAEKKAGTAALKSATREKFLNLTVKGVGVRIPLKQTGKLISEGYLKSYLPEKFEEGVQYAFQQTYNKQAEGFTQPSFINATGTFIKDAFDAATSIGFIPGMRSSLGGKYANDEEFQLSADLGGLLGGASAGIGIVNSVRKAGVAFNQAYNKLDKLGFYDPSFTADKISGHTLKELLKSNKIEYITKLIQDQKSLLEQKGELNKIYKYSKDELRSLQDDPELKNIKELQAQLGAAATSELNNTVDFLEREHFRNKLYDNNTTPSQQYDRFIKQINRAQEIYNSATEQLGNVKSDKFFSTVNKDVRSYADALSIGERSRFLKSFGGKTRVRERLEQSIAEHAMAVARAEQDITHVDNMVKEVISDEEKHSYFKIPKLRELLYDEMLVADMEDAVTEFEVMSSLNPNISPELKDRVEFVKKRNRAKRLDINNRFEQIKQSLTEPLEGSNSPSLKEQQDYLDQFIVKGEGYTRFNREFIRNNPKLINPTTLELMKERSRRSTTFDFSTEQLSKLSNIKTASQLAAWHNSKLTNVEKQLIKDRATRLKELEMKANATPQEFTEEDEKESNDLKDALDIPQDATPEEVLNSISDSASETDVTESANVVTDVTIQLDNNFDFSIMPSNPMAKVQLNNYDLASNIRGIKTRIKKNEVFTITEVNNDAGYFSVTTQDGKTTVKIPIKNGPLDGTREVGKSTETNTQDNLDNAVTNTIDAPVIDVAAGLDPLPTTNIIPQEVKDIQSTKVEEVKNALSILNNKQFIVNPNNENTYVETDASGNIIKDEDGNPIEYNRVSTLKGGGTDIKGDSADRGTIIDSLLRGFINNEITSIKDLITEYNKHPKKNSVREFTPKFLGEMFNIFTQIKQSTDAVGMQLISTIPTLWGKIGNGNFAGTIDLMGIAKDGSVYIIDLKTSSRNRRDVNDEFYETYKLGDSIQQSAYGELLRQQTGIVVKGLTIFPLQTSISNNAYNGIIPNLSESGKFTMPVQINKAIFPEASNAVSEKEITATQESTTSVVSSTELSRIKDSINDTPILKSSASNFEIFYIPKKVYELAYNNDEINKTRTGGAQPLDKIIQRGGYSMEELDNLLPNWKQIVTLENTTTSNKNEPVIVDLKYRGKLIYSSSGSGKSTLVKNAEGLVDADDLLQEAILEVEPSGQVSIKEVYSLPIWNSVRQVFFNKIKQALSENKTVLSANKAVRMASSSELKIDYVFLHKTPTEFVQRTKDRSNSINDFVASKLYNEEQVRFPNANGYYTEGVTITDFLKEGNSIPDSNADVITDVKEQVIAPKRNTNKVDGRLALSYNFFTKADVRTNDSNTVVENKKSRMNAFIASSPEQQQTNYSVVSNPVNTNQLNEFKQMGLNVSTGNVPIELLFNDKFNPNGLSSEQITALQNGQPILIAVNNVIGNVFNIADQNGEFMEIGSPYRLVLVKPTKTSNEVSNISGDDQVFINSGSLTAELFNPNKYGTDYIGNLIKFNNESKQATQDEIENFVDRFNESLKIYNTLSNLPVGTPIQLSNLEGIVSVKTSIGKLNFTNNTSNISELPESMLYPFGKDSGIVAVDITTNGIRTVYSDKNKLSESNNQKVLKLDLGNTAGLKLVIAHPTIPNRLLYLNIEMPSTTVDTESQGLEILNIISNKVQSIVDEGLDLNRDVKSYNDKMAIFGKFGSIQIASNKLKNTFFNLKVSFKDNKPMFYLEIKNTKIGSGIIKLSDLIESNPQSLNDFIEVIHSKLTNPELKELFKNSSGEDFKAAFSEISINAIINNAQTRLSTVQPLTNPGVSINLVNDLQGNIAAISNTVDQNAVSSLEDTTGTEQGEVNYGEMFDDIYDMSGIAINQMLKQTGRTKQALRDYIVQNKIIVIQPDQISDILTKMC